MTLLRAGIFDMLTRSRSIQVRELLVRVGVPAESLPEDVLRAIDYPVANMPTVPRANTNLTSIMIGEMVGEWVRTRPTLYGL